MKNKELQATLTMEQAMAASLGTAKEQFLDRLSVLIHEIELTEGWMNLDGVVIEFHLPETNSDYRWAWNGDRFNYEKKEQH